MVRTKATKPAPEEATTLEEPVAEAMVIGPTPAPWTPAWFMGIGSRAETTVEHNARLKGRARTITDMGWVLGTLAPRADWPTVGGPVVAPAGPIPIEA